MLNLANRIYPALLLLLVIICRAHSQNLTNCANRCVVDGRVYCVDASAEASGICGQKWCPASSFRCNNGTCIGNATICDGFPDCPDGEDEQSWLCNAAKHTNNCSNWEFLCASGRCVPFAKLCDGKSDCPAGDDEQELLCGEGGPVQKLNTTAAELDIVLMTTTQSTPSYKASCVVPQLPKLIVKRFNDAVLQAGARVENGSLIYYDCPVDHTLKGKHRNRCKAPIWIDKFPFCENAATSFQLGVIIPIFSFIIIILLILLYRLRRVNDRRMIEDHICLYSNGDHDISTQQTVQVKPHFNYRKKMIFRKPSNSNVYIV